MQSYIVKLILTYKYKTILAQCTPEPPEPPGFCMHSRESTSLAGSTVHDVWIEPGNDWWCLTWALGQHCFFARCYFRLNIVRGRADRKQAWTLTYSNSHSKLTFKESAVSQHGSKPFSITQEYLSMAQHSACLKMAQHGSVWFSSITALLNMAQHGWAWLFSSNTALLNMAQHGSAWLNMAQHGSA